MQVASQRSWSPSHSLINQLDGYSLTAKTENATFRVSKNQILGLVEVGLKDNIPKETLNGTYFCVVVPAEHSQSLDGV